MWNVERCVIIYSTVDTLMECSALCAYNATAIFEPHPITELSYYSAYQESLCICIFMQGYLNMKLLHRLRYILEVCAPPTPLPSHLLDVVTMVARHSVYAATEVSQVDMVGNQ